MLCTLHTGTTPLNPHINKRGMKIVPRLYQMTFIKECLLGEGV